MAMTEQRRRKLARQGWQVGTVAQFLRLTPEESALIEMQLALADALKSTRTKRGLSQAALARRLGSSQSRVAKMESGHPSVSLELLIRALLVLGLDRKAIGRTLQRRAA
jgi:ribosome-binding protein aMBF1 (putative translation factor)